MKIIKIIFTISASILVATFLLGCVTLGQGFKFEYYNILGWIIASMWYILCISLGLIFLDNELKDK